ncbi:unnamed protein product [Ostreobium quekettii]|uniref:DOMON domain-containing protein n=1 Tax=Ostreobium quekettii TaxID=121088 RepID=A0A8S1JAK9_9CHLO|nr:unnamed protein product [Ostreobium quekettii]
MAQNINFTCYVVKNFTHWYEASEFQRIQTNQATGRAPQYCSQASSLDGYACMQQLAPYFALHWRIGGKISALQDQSDKAHNVAVGEIAFAMMGLTPGWVGLAFAQKQGEMAPADGIIGWLSDGVATVKAYKIHSHTVRLGDEDRTICLRNASATEENGFTTIEFRRLMRAGRVHIHPTKPMFVNFAIGREDGLTNHHHRGRGSVLLSLDSEKSPVHCCAIHASLMLIAWLGLLPLVEYKGKGHLLSVKPCWNVHGTLLP